MQLGLTVTALVLGVTVLFAIAGYLIDLSARHHDKGDR
jgi:preprotein translocase subunit SecE